MRPAILALLALGCADGAVPMDSDEPTPCEGLGDATVEIGSGGRANFEAFAPGDAIATAQQGADWGLQIELLTTGLDASQEASSVVRIRFEPGAPTEDFAGQVMLQCDEDEGIAWAGVFARLPEPWQGYPGSLVDATITVSATITDASGEAATDEVELVVAGG